jgi:DNA (cytosine-5)-methyltransferase 1
MKRNERKKVKVIDLFCGIGGMTHGFVNEGFEVVAGIDNDPTCEYGYVRNNRASFVCKDIAEVTGDDLLKLYGDCDTKILIGCAPCQPFSHLNPGSLREEKLVPLQRFAKLISEIRPDVVSMENVKGLVDKGGDSIFREFTNTLESCGYRVSCRVVDTSEYGVPQRRMRLVLLASLFGEILLIPPTHAGAAKKTVRDAIGKLRALVDGEVDAKDPLHRARKLSPLNRKRIKATSKDGGSSSDWRESLKLACHKKPSGKTYSWSVYGRMRWDEPSPTMTTQCTGLGNGRFGHPEQDRAITPREAALIQTFPRGYKFFPKGNKFIMSQVSKHIGNAVPVELGAVIARSIKLHMQEYA